MEIISGIVATLFAAVKKRASSTEALFNPSLLYLVTQLSFFSSPSLEASSFFPFFFPDR
jgi:hypothetical protein